MNNTNKQQKDVEGVEVLREQLETILDACPAMIFYKDKENRFIRVNAALAKANGRTKEEIEGKTCWDIYDKEEADYYWLDDKEVIKSGKPKLNIVEKMVTPSGTRWVQTDKILYKDSKGEIVGIIGFTLDITDRKEAEEYVKTKLAEIEHMNKLMMGREMKMVELKRENEELRKKLAEFETIAST
jgi:PAS domain S-box-containing protein